MQSLKDKILEGFFTNVGADPFINWINDVFRNTPTNTRYCHRMYIMSKETAEVDRYKNEYIVAKAGGKSLLFKGRKKQIIVNISEIPELLNIKPDDIMSIFYMDDKKNIKFMFGQLIKESSIIDTYINNVLLTIDKKTCAIIDKEIIPKFLISEVHF